MKAFTNFTKKKFEGVGGGKIPEEIDKTLPFSLLVVSHPLECLRLCVFGNKLEQCLAHLTLGRVVGLVTLAAAHSVPVLN